MLMPQCPVVNTVQQNKNHWIKMNKRAKTLKLGQSLDLLQMPIEDSDTSSDSLR